MVTFAIALIFASTAAPTFYDQVIAPVRRLQVGSTCDDGNAAVNGCCSASQCSSRTGNTGEECCPGCCISCMVQSSGGGSSTCTATICGDSAGLGDLMAIDSQCTVSGCSGYLSGLGYTYDSAMSILGCEMCVGNTGTDTYVCFPDTSSRDTCFSQSNRMNPSRTLSAGSDSRILCTDSGSSSSSTSSGGSDSDEPCFASSATVTKSDGTSSRVDALAAGDTIVAATKDGVITTDTISPISIAKHEAKDEVFVSLTTTTGRTIVLTGAHHLPVGATCCSVLKQAKDVEIGEPIWEVDSTGAFAAATTIAEKGAVKGDGLHSPVLTNGHFPVVDGVITSFDAIGKVTLASYGLRFLDAACKATGTCDAIRRTIFG
eukprot:CAMPEP_0174723608 /NCGR_PEP_ID=MMETSP1094-20130205/41422_1 /TAXON_ID=156173 /ORGANISM="Chrysochromulina brevifilum, Strain UTEX LB 985" /LENGTH=373 /DNA_ID=CAMNT_0015924685 /DNA_START=19 /DNA_END=1140 /DNA_ORIENTATION=+